jgi:hypothetical protein
MDKTRHPHVIRTWRVERTKVLYRPPRPVKLRSYPVFSRSRRTEPVPTPHNAPPKAAKTVSVANYKIGLNSGAF